MKVLFLTDSLGLPRIFPEDEILYLEETYSQIVKNNLKNFDFFQITLTGEPCDKIINQARGYLVNWRPDFIIVGIGINDARPPSLLIKLQENKFFKYIFKIKIIKKIIEKLQKNFKKINLSTTSLNEFEKRANQLKNSFKDSKIIWLEIVCDNKYENTRPGVIYWKSKFNEKLKSIFGNDFLQLSDLFTNKKVFNSDNLHYNKFGHKIVSEEILKKINSK